MTDEYFHPDDVDSYLLPDGYVGEADGLYDGIDIDELRERVREDHAAYMEKWAPWTAEQRAKWLHG